MEDITKLMLVGFTTITCVEGLNGVYGINESGDVYNVAKKRIVKRSKHSLGYEQVYLSPFDPTTRGKWHKVHRLVAMTFIPNPLGLTDVNHKNGIKSDNRLENLEWMTHSDNVLHSYRVLGRVAGAHTKKSIACSNGKTYDSLKEAATDTGCQSPNISMCCKGKIKQTKGLIFKYNT